MSSRNGGDLWSTRISIQIAVADLHAICLRNDASISFRGSAPNIDGAPESGASSESLQDGFLNPRSRGRLKLPWTELGKKNRF